MTYSQFLLIFLIVPILILTGLALFGRWSNQLRTLDVKRSLWWAIGITSLIALLYTTPWDNYLVATKVWWYRPELVFGFAIGWVPLEEYLFFILQPLLTGLFFVGSLVLLIRRNIHFVRLPTNEDSKLKKMGIIIMLVSWILSWLLLFFLPATCYLGLLLVWAIPPLLLQWWLGWRWLLAWWKPLIVIICFSTAYLAITDVLAISQGIWTINPDYSLGNVGPLPVEEILFFAITNLLIVCSITLILRSSVPRRFVRTHRE